MIPKWDDLTHTNLDNASYLFVAKLRQIFPDVLESLRKMDLLDSLTEDERSVIVTVLNLFEELGTDYSDSELLTAWADAKVQLEQLPKWKNNNYW
tara:strand:+ start:1585 stop:1869 length:285 start_codon:yes stop_codon:yes gene_type:complete